VETGSEAVMNRASKGITVAKVLDAVKLASSIVPHLLLPFMWGFPYETLEDLRQTVNIMTLCADRFKASVRLGMVVPMPGAPLTRESGEDIFYSEEVLPFNKSKYYLKAHMMDMVLGYQDIFSCFYTFRTPDFGKKVEMLRRLFPGECYEGRIA
jgi:radical SAM superfamily enzyme YgiQ (UPF0313 family)